MLLFPQQNTIEFNQSYAHMEGLEQLSNKSIIVISMLESRGELQKDPAIIKRFGDYERVICTN